MKVRVTFTAEMGEPTVWRAGYGDNAEVAFLLRLRSAVGLLGGAHMTVTDIGIEEVKA